MDINKKRLDDIRTYQSDFIKATAPDTDGDEPNLFLGKVIKAAYGIREFRGRRCATDFCAIEIDREREPIQPYQPLIETTPPNIDPLMPLNWDPVHKVGPLEFDEVVMKRGAVTGDTYGVIGGVHALRTGTETTEYFIIPFGKLTAKPFSDKATQGRR